jgi:hypothetical protein
VQLYNHRTSSLSPSRFFPILGPRKGLLWRLWDVLDFSLLQMTRLVGRPNPELGKEQLSATKKARIFRNSLLSIKVLLSIRRCCHYLGFGESVPVFLSKSSELPTVLRRLIAWVESRIYGSVISFNLNAAWIYFAWWRQLYHKSPFSVPVGGEALYICIQGKNARARSQEQFGLAMSVFSNRNHRLL